MSDLPVTYASGKPLGPVALRLRVGQELGEVRRAFRKATGTEDTLVLCGKHEALLWVLTVMNGGKPLPGPPGPAPGPDSYFDWDGNVRRLPPPGETPARGGADDGQA